MIGIYCITHLPDDYKYIGQSVDIENRLLEYKGAFSSTEKPMRISETLYELFMSSSIEDFSFEILEECPRELLDERESYYIELYHTYVGDTQCKGYNKTTGGKGTPGVIYSDEVRESRSLRMLGNTLNSGRIPTEEARMHMSESAPKTHSPEHNRKVGETLRAKGIRPQREDSEKIHERMLGNQNLKGKRFINKDGNTKAVDEALLPSYIEEGWKIGMAKRGIK